MGERCLPGAAPIAFMGRDMRPSTLLKKKNKYRTNQVDHKSNHSYKLFERNMFVLFSLEL